MEHIDAQSLNTNLEYRFAYVCKFVGFGEADIAAIKGSAKYIAPLVPSIVESVYIKLFSFDITRSFFLKRHHGFAGQLDTAAENLKQDSEQIRFRKDMLSKYLTKLVTAEYDAKFVAYLDWVGKIHTNRAGARSISVDYVHINALMGYVEDILLKAIPTLNLEKSEEVKLIRAFNKLLWVQNDLFARHYITTPEEEKLIEEAKSLKSASKAQSTPLTGIRNAAVFGICTAFSLWFLNHVAPSSATPSA